MIMKRLLISCRFLAIIIPTCLQAQNDSIRLSCPLTGGVVVPPPRNTIHYDPPDLCIVLSSIPDTLVKACVPGRVTNVEASSDDDGKWEVVLFYKFKKKEYYFWYSGLETATVKRNDVLKDGQSIGTIKPGGKIELLMYDFETQVDPSGYLNCTFILKN